MFKKTNEGLEVSMLENTRLFKTYGTIVKFLSENIAELDDKKISARLDSKFKKLNEVFTKIGLDSYVIVKNPSEKYENDYLFRVYYHQELEPLRKCKNYRDYKIGTSQDFLKVENLLNRVQESENFHYERFKELEKSYNDMNEDKQQITLEAIEQIKNLKEILPKEYFELLKETIKKL